MTWMMPAPPPMKSAAATMLVAKKAIATGTPSIIKPTPRPKRIRAAQYHSTPLHLGLPGGAAQEIFPADEKAQEFDRHHGKRQRYEADHHPARHVERAHVLLVLHEIADGHERAVPREHRTDDDAERADQIAQHDPLPRAEIHEDDLD